MSYSYFGLQFALLKKPQISPMPEIFSLGFLVSARRFSALSSFVDCWGLFRQAPPLDAGTSS